MGDLKEISVVLPAYLEEENLRLLLPRLKAVMFESGLSHEILVVDTETAMDRTEDCCNSHSVRHVPRRGGNTFGCAVRTGIQEARGRSILFMDADGSHTPEFIPELLAFRESHDVVIASRYAKGGMTENPFILILMSQILNITYSLVLNLKCKDVSNSFKLYRAEYLKSLELKSQNFDIIEELLYKMSRQHPGLRIREVPFTFKKRMFGRTKRNLIAFMFTYLITILKLRFDTIGKRNPELSRQ